MLIYPLVDGYLHHWLTVGPIDQRLDVAPRRDERLATFAARVLAERSSNQPDFAQVVELDRVPQGDGEHVWEVTHCAEDHWLAWFGDLSTFSHRQAWGYTQLHSTQRQTVTLHCTLTCAARLWLNGLPLLHAPVLHAPDVTLSETKGLSGAALQDDSTTPASFRAERGIPSGSAAEGDSSFPYRTGPTGQAQTPCIAPLRERNDAGTVSVQVTLNAGANPLLLRLESVGVRAVALMAALRVEQNAPDAPPIILHLPTITAAPRRRQQWEEVYAQTRLDRAVYGKRDPIRLLAPSRARNIPVQLRLQKASGAIYAETIDKLNPGAILESVSGSQLPNGPLEAVVMAPFQQFYNEGMRARHTIPILIANQPFHTHPGMEAHAQTSDARLIEALRAQVQSGDSIYSELAKMAFGGWAQVDHQSIKAAAARVMEGAAGALPDLLGLITMRYRMPAYQGFPRDLLPILERTLTHFAARGDDMQLAWDADDEAVHFALLTARHLVRQLIPAARGATTGNASGEAGALVAWLAERGRYGFAHWHSDYDLVVTTLAPLVSLAQEDDVRESAAALLDALLLVLATHTVSGTFGASRARVTPNTLRSGRFAPEAALMRLLWGTGGYQTGTEAAVALGLAGNSYALPDVIPAIALAQPDAAWVLERHGDANIATFRTPDYLLSSAQAYRTGEPGAREQIWQATLGPEALVFGNHPGTFSQDENAAPGWWVGNDVLPRVAQYHDALLARYTLPAGAWLHFTHLYFPAYAFDEHTFVENWAFARVGDGYVALWSDPGFVRMEHGPDAGRELRVQGRDAVWLCQMGRRATDGDFASFQRKVLASVPQVHAEVVTWTTLRGDTLALSNVGPLLVNGQAVALDNFPRHSSPFGHAGYPATQHDPYTLGIVYGEDGLRLRF